MGFKVGDRVVNVRSGYTLANELEVTTGVVTKVNGDGDGCMVIFDGLKCSYYCEPGDVELLPTPPRKMHPDDFMLAINEFASDNGFCVTQLEFHGTEFIGAALPRHSYSV
jgi:hypothetical protein